MRNRYRSSHGQRVIRDWCEDRIDRWTIAHHRRVVTTSIGETHLTLAGDGPATVLYLPGTNFGAATSLPVAEHLAATVRVVVADLPGQPGLSAGRAPDGDLSSGYGAWAGEVVQHLHHAYAATGPLVVVGHSLGAAVALAAPTAGIDGLALLNPAGLIRLRVPADVLRATLPWVLRPTERRSRALLAHLTAPDRTPPSILVQWMTLVARHSRPTGAPGPLPEALVHRWSGTPRLVLSGQHDCFLPPQQLAPVVQQRLGTELSVLAGMGHLSVDDAPIQIARTLATFAVAPG